MPDIIGVTLESISLDRNALSIPVKISGRTFGTALRSNQPVQQLDIFTFPDGPITLSPQQPTAITMNQVVFDLQGQDPAGSNPTQIKITGELTGIGNASFLFDEYQDSLPSAQPTDENPQGQPPRKFPLAFKSDNVDVTLTFGIIQLNYY